MLSQEGRGFSEVVVYKENIRDIMLQLLAKCDLPILVNIQVSFPFEIFPYPIPDLYFGQPLVIYHCSYDF